MAKTGSPEVPSRERIRTLPLWIRVVGTGFFTGYVPIAPGTAGSLLALAIYWFVRPLDDWPLLAILTLVTIFVGIHVSKRIHRILGGDPSIVVIDEMAGMWVALITIPRSPYTALLAFFLFRFFDIMKPPPASTFDRMKGGVGIMMDDVVAGIYTNIVLQLVILVLSM